MTGCPMCGTALEQARSLVHPAVEATLRQPRGSWCCAGCLGVVVEEEDGEVGTRVPGAAVIRAIEHLRGSRDDGRLAEEATRMANDPILWFVGRVPEVFSLFGWKSVKAVSLVDRGIVYVPDPGTFEADGQHMAVDYFRANPPKRGSVHRAFDEFDVLPESISPTANWARMAGYLPDRRVLRVVAVSAPAIAVSAKDVFDGKPMHSQLDAFWIYADALIPHLGA